MLQNHRGSSEALGQREPGCDSFMSRYQRACPLLALGEEKGCAGKSQAADQHTGYITSPDFHAGMSLHLFTDKALSQMCKHTKAGG